MFKYVVTIESDSGGSLSASVQVESEPLGSVLPIAQLGKMAGYARAAIDGNVRDVYEHIGREHGEDARLMFMAFFTVAAAKDQRAQSGKIGTRSGMIQAEEEA